MRHVRNRHSIRLHKYDYSQNGAYFVTVCSYQRACIFGEIVGDVVTLSEIGQIVDEEWQRTAQLRPGVILDEYVIMPNHIHMIIMLEDVGTSQQPKPDFLAQPRSISTIIRGFKGMVTTRMNTVHESPGKPLWQRNYYEHTIRNEQALNAIREYIRLNPIQWTDDNDNPKNMK